MNIRKKLAYQFTIIVSAILLLFTVSIYFFSSDYRKNDFYARLNDRAVTTAKLLIEVKEVDSLLLKIIDRNTTALNDECIRIFNFKNEEIYNSNDDDTAKYSADFINSIRIKGEIRKESGQTEILGISYSEYPKKYVLIASAYDKFGFSKLRNLRIILIVGFLVCIFFTVVSGMFYAGRALKPISNVVGQVNKITASNLNLRLSTGNGKDEIANLSITFNEMLSRLETSFETQKNFVSNASHEFRTPFAIILSEIELSLMKERTNQEYVEALSSVAQEIKNLHNLSENLLELTRASLDASAFQFAPLRIDELVLQSREYVLKTKPDYSVNIDFSNLPDDDSLITFTGNEQLLSLAFYNLMSNSCKFSPDKKVNVILKTASKEITIKFVDNGIGIPENEIQNIFEPFFRASNSGERKGHGLGLPLVKKIVELHKGKIKVSSMLNRGSSFTISLPL
ncbi:MAG: HAMP domain-containing sensor histidine kinase [Bacteroidota bacterium]